MNYRTSIISMLLTTGLVVIACGDKAKKTAAPQPTNISDLKLSSALLVKLPESLEKAGGGKAPSSQLRLADDKKRSYEACDAISKIDQAVSESRSTGSFLCHLEVEKIEFGKKYNINFQNIEGGGSQEAQVWIDNSDPANINVYYCMDKKLVIKSTINGFQGAGLIKGKMLSKFAESQPDMAFSYTGSTDFDFTTAGTKIIKSSSKGTSSTTTPSTYSSDFRDYAEMTIVDSGVSSLLVSKDGTYSYSSNGTQSSGTYDDQSAILFNGTVGQALRKQDANYYRATFDKDGYVVAASQASADVTIDKAKLPAKLAASFTPEEPSGWDCATTENLTIDIQAADKKTAHDACEIEWPEYQCSGGEFQYGQSEQ